MAIYMEKSKLLVPTININQYSVTSNSTTEGEQDWSESIWSLGSGSMDHENLERSNVEEHKQSDVGGPRPKEENLSSPPPPVLMRKKHGSTRSPIRSSQKQMSLEEGSLHSFGPRPQLTSTRSLDPCPDEKMQRPFFGLDCYELMRRNSMPVSLKTRSNLPRCDRRPESWQHSMPVTPPINPARLNLLRTSLPEDQPAQTSPDVGHTKPPRPPTQGTESVPVGRVAEIVNRVESQLLQSEGSERVPADSLSAVRADIGGRDSGLRRQQSVEQAATLVRRASDTLVNKRPLLVDKVKRQPSESASYLIRTFEPPQMSIHAGVRNLSASNEPPVVTDHRRRGTPLVASMQLRPEQASPSPGQGERGQVCGRHASDTQSYKPFFARMSSAQAEETRNRRSSDTKVTRAHISPQISTRRSFDTYNAKSAESENKTATKTPHDDGGRIRQQLRIVVSEEKPLHTPKNETDKYSTLKGWFPEPDSILLADPKFPALPSLSSVLSADFQQTVTSFSPPPSNQPHSRVSSPLRRNCVYVSRATVSPSRRINRALTLPAVRQRTPSPPRLVDDSTSISDSSDIHSSPSHSTSVSLFELLQFCHLQAVVINSNLVAARLRPVWWAVDPITYLGLRVTNVQLRLPESENLKVVPAYHAAPVGNVHTMATHPDSAFKPVTPRHNSGQPCVLLIEEVYEGFPATAVPKLRAGQILVELNGVSLLSTPTNTDRLTLLRSTLLNVLRALDAGACRGVALTVATPNKPVSRSDRGDLVVKSVAESFAMLPDFAEISLQSQPPPVPTRQRQQGQEEPNNPELEVGIRNSANASLLRVNSSSSCSTCSSNQDRVLFGRICQ